MSRRMRLPRDAGYPPMGHYRTNLAGAAVPYLVCPLSCVLAWPTVAGAHEWWGTNPWAAAGITMAGTGLTALTWVAGRPRGTVRQTVSTLLAAGASAWTLGATINAPWQRPWLDLWAAGSVTASVAMAIMRLMAKPHGDDTTGTAGGGLAEAVAALRDARIGKPKVQGSKVRSSIAMRPGDTIAEVEGARDQIASVLDVAPGAVRVHRDPDSIRTGALEVVPVDQLRHPIPWGGPSAPGRSVGDAPFRVGRAEDGDPVQLWLTGRPGVRPATHIRATGMTGAGKSEWALGFLADYATRTDGALIVVDTVKREQTVKPVRQGITLLITDDATADQFFDLLEQEIIPARTQALAEEDLTEWMPGCKLSHLLVWVEESAAWADHPAMVPVGERARSAGISLVLSQQRWTHDRAPTSLRGQFATNVCFGIDGRDDPMLALSETTVDAGACPQTWGSSKPGYFYVESPSIPQDRWATPCRGELPNRPDLTQAVTAWGHVRRPLDVVTARCLAPVMPTSASVGGSTGPQQSTDPDRDDDEDRPGGYAPGVNPDDPPDDVDPAKELDVQHTPRRMSLALPERIDPAQARSVLRQYIAGLLDQGQTELRPADLGDVLAETGYGHTWLSKALAELASGPMPLLTRLDRNGRYRIRRPGPATPA